MGKSEANPDGDKAPGRTIEFFVLAILSAIAIIVSVISLLGDTSRGKLDILRGNIQDLNDQVQVLRGKTDELLTRVENAESEIEELKANKPAPLPSGPFVDIKSPQENQSVPIAVPVTGSYANLPDGHQIWVMVRPANSPLLFPQSGPALASGGQWSATNIRVGNDSDAGTLFQILPVITTSGSGAVFSARLAAGDFSGMDKLPPGATPQHPVTVKRS